MISGSNVFFGRDFSHSDYVLHVLCIFILIFFHYFYGFISLFSIHLLYPDLV